MIEISFGKLVLLALVALIVLGPEKLPGAARTAGALLRRVRSGWDSVRAEVERELEVEEIRRAAREAAARAEAAQSEFKDSVQQVREPLHEAAETLKSAAAPAPAAEATQSEVQQSLPLGEPAAVAETKEPAHGGH
ncbi:MAG: hypothetical protein RSP_28460 [Rhodanobacter sp.]